MIIVKLLRSKLFWIQLGIALLISLGLLFGLMSYLKVYTKHGQEIEVPDLMDLHVDQLGSLLATYQLQHVVVDSAFLKGKPAHLVYDQDPKPGSKVKEGRSIYVSITSSNTPKVLVPELVDLSLRKATIDLKNLGLELGALIMRPDIANNVVLEMQQNGKRIPAGKEIPKGSLVDLVVGIYNIDSMVSVPNLVGLTIEEARFYLSENALYLGMVQYEGTITDTTKALVIRQNPEINDEEEITTMSYVDIWVAEN